MSHATAEIPNRSREQTHGKIAGQGAGARPKAENFRSCPSDCSVGSQLRPRPRFQPPSPGFGRSVSPTIGLQASGTLQFGTQPSPRPPGLGPIPRCAGSAPALGLRASFRHPPAMGPVRAMSRITLSGLLTFRTFPAPLQDCRLQHSEDPARAPLSLFRSGTGHRVEVRPMALPETRLQSASSGCGLRRLIRSFPLRPSWLLAPRADRTAATPGRVATLGFYLLPDITTAANWEFRRRDFRPLEQQLVPRHQPLAPCRQRLRRIRPYRRRRPDSRGRPRHHLRR